MASVVAAPQPEATAAAHDRPSRPTKSTLAAKLKGALFLALLIIVAALSTTVLRKPLLRSADWLRAQEEAGFAIIGAVGFVFMMVSGSTHLFDVVCGFFCGPLPGALAWHGCGVCVCVCRMTDGRSHLISIRTCNEGQGSRSP